MNQYSNAIRSKSIDMLAVQGVPVHPHLPLLDCSKLRNTEEIAKRMVALYCMAGLANEADPESVLDWLKSDGLLDCLEAPEVEMLQRKSLDDEQLNECSWKEESLYALAWCVDQIPDLPPPDKGCDMNEIYEKIPPAVGFAEYVRGIRARPAETIWQQLDYFYNLHASLEHTELWKWKWNGLKKRERFLLPAIVERRHALEWVCSPRHEWSEISLDT